MLFILERLYERPCVCSRFCHTSAHVGPRDKCSVANQNRSTADGHLGRFEILYRLDKRLLRPLNDFGELGREQPARVPPQPLDNFGPNFVRRNRQGVRDTIDIRQKFVQGVDCSRTIPDEVIPALANCNRFIQPSALFDHFVGTAQQ